MKRWINTAIAIFFFFCLHNQAYANHRSVDGLIIGGGTGAIMGQAIGRNVESTILGATVGGIIGAVITSEQSNRHHSTVVVHERPRGPHGRDFNYAPRHQPPRVVFDQSPSHGKRHYKKGHGCRRFGHRSNGHQRYDVQYNDCNWHHQPHHRNQYHR